MNKEIKNKWVKALKSGEYKQTDGTLRHVDETGDKFCCLGVLCDLHRKIKIKKSKDKVWKVMDGFGGDCNYYNTNENSILPDIVLQWAGLTARNPRVLKTNLIALNDEGKPFSQIADIINENL